MKAFPSRGVQFLAFCLFGLLIVALFLTRRAWFDMPQALGPEGVRPSPRGVMTTFEPTRDAAVLRGVDDTLGRAWERYQEIQGYQAQFQKRELSRDGTWKSEVMFLKFEKPFTLYMRWTEGDRKGTEILYSRGYYGNKILVRPPGFLFKFIPIIHLAPEDRRLRAHEKHSIDHAGIGYFLEEFVESFKESLDAGKVEVLWNGPDSVVGERVRRIGVSFSDPTYRYPRTEVAISEEHGLPVEIRLYDSKSMLVEVYRYLHLAVNPRRDDPLFRENADFRMFDLFSKVP